MQMKLGTEYQYGKTTESWPLVNGHKNVEGIWSFEMARGCCSFAAIQMQKYCFIEQI